MVHYAPQRGHISIDANGVLMYRGPYVPELVIGFKSFPAAFRDYAPDRGKAWTIQPPYAEEALSLVLRYLPDVEVQYTRQAKTPSSPPASNSFAILHLLPTAPPELIDAAYRVLAKKAHPDVGGDAATMRRLTEAHAVLSRRLSA